MTADRPFVDRPVADREAAARAAARQAAEWDLPAPTLLRYGMNALFACDGVVIRVGMATAPASASHAVVGWLQDAGVPTVTPSPGMAADVDGFAVTGWCRVRETRRAIDWVEIGRAVRLVHALDPAACPDDYPVPDPAVFPWWHFDDLLAELADDIDPSALDGIRAALERNAGWQDRLRSGAVLCHGDVHPGNVLVTSEGSLLVDWDLMCTAAPAWDHAMLTTYADRWGGDPTAYRRFAAGYGRSMADDPLTRSLGELRNVAATLLRVRAGRTDPAAADEAEHRLRFWRGGSTEPWHAQ